MGRFDNEAPSSSYTHLSRPIIDDYNFSQKDYYSNPTSTTSPDPSLLSLPIELQLSLLPHLPYPDTLALKHTSRLFYNLIASTDPAAGIKKRVAWLVERHERGLPCPDRQCVLKTDESFCRSGKGQVRRLMEVRRRHGECKVGEGGCEVVRGRNCGGRRYWEGRRGFLMRKGAGWWRESGGSSMWVVWIVGLLLASLGINIWMLWMRHVDNEGAAA